MLPRHLIFSIEFLGVLSHRWGKLSDANPFGQDPLDVLESEFNSIVMPLNTLHLQVKILNG